MRPITQFMHDYMHGMASSGCLNVAIFLVLEAIQAAGLKPWVSLQSYMSCWVLPVSLKRSCNMSAVFSEKRVKSHREAERLKVPASEVLCLFPILQYIAQTVAKQVPCQNAVRAFLACCHFMELLLGTHHNKVTGHMLDCQAEKILTAFKEAEWGDACIKKFHWLLHYGDSLEVHKQLVPCWAMERKHKQVTSVATSIANLSKYEQSVYFELLSGQLHRFKAPLPPVPCLEKDSEASTKLKTFLKQHMDTRGQPIHSSHTLLLQAGGRIAVRDIILVDNDTDEWECGEVWANFSVGSCTYSLVSLFEFVKKDRVLRSYTWKEEPGKPTIVPAHEIVTALTFSRAATGLVTLIPWHLQSK